MAGERQYFTFRQTRRTVPMTFSMIFVQASDRRNSAGRPSRARDMIPFRGARLNIRINEPLSFGAGMSYCSFLGVTHILGIAP